MRDQLQEIWNRLAAERDRVLAELPALRGNATRANNRLAEKQAELAAVESGLKHAEQLLLMWDETFASRRE